MIKYFIKSNPNEESNVKLLCSYNFQVGDKVMDESFTEGTVLNMDDLHNVEVALPHEGSSLTCIVPECNDLEWKSENEMLFKVIGKISADAHWVKDGDEFNEDEVTYDYITDSWEIKCSTCKRFH